MKNEKLISICKYNKEHFEKDEDVVIYIEVKNIPQIKVKIFELVLENYYL
jgi:hypothetical protein